MEQIEIDSSYCVHCIRCGDNKELTMLPNRNGRYDMVGFHFVCLTCLPYISGKQTRTEFGDEEIKGDIQ